MDSSQRIKNYITDADTVSYGITMVTREEWEARPPKRNVRLSLPVNLVFIHHTAMHHVSTDSLCCAAVRAVQDYHMDNKGWDDIGYNFLVGGDGRVYVGRGWENVGAHTKGYNSQSLSVAFMGNYATTKPSAIMLTAAQNLIQYGNNQGYIRRDYSLHGHRDASTTESPGEALYNLIEMWPDWHKYQLPKPLYNKPSQLKPQEKKTFCCIIV